MGKYFSSFKNSISSNLTYRFSLFAEISSTALSFLVMVYIWRIVYRGGLVEPAYTITALITYYTFATFVSFFTQYTSATWIVSQDVESGDLSSFLVSPYSYLSYVLVSSVAFTLSRVVFAVPLLLVLAWFFGISLPDLSLYQLFALVFFLIAGFFINYCLGSMMGLFSVWLKRSFGVTYIYWSISSLFSGAIVPIELLPRQIGDFAHYLPFMHMVYTPIALTMGRLSDPEILVAVWQIGFWMLFLQLMLYFVWRRAILAYQGESM